MHSHTHGHAADGTGGIAFTAHAADGVADYMPMSAALSFAAIGMIVIVSSSGPELVPADVLARARERRVLTDDEAGQVSWYLSRIHAVRFLSEYPHGTRRAYLLDIDFPIASVRPGGQLVFHFWVCPATLVFDGLAGVTFELKSEVFDPGQVIVDDMTLSGGGGSVHEYSIKGDILDAHVSARQLFQYLRTPPVYSERPWLSSDTRGGVSFAESAFPD